MPQQTFFDDLVADLSEVATEIETKPNIVGYNHSAAQKQKIKNKEKNMDKNSLKKFTQQ